MLNFFKKAFSNMVEEANEQHEVDKANFNAVKAESKANFKKAKALSRPENAKQARHEERMAQIAKANTRIQNANNFQK